MPALPEIAPEWEHMSMPALASSPTMVGRRAELGTLLAAFDEGEHGSPRTVIVRGEAGIGKTRLVQELISEAEKPRASGLPLIIAVGQCIDLGPIGAPFGPIRRVLRDLHLAVGSRALRAAAGSPAALATLAAFVPGLAETDETTAEHPGEFAEAIEVVLERLSADRHLLVVVEDLQWADAATLALLKTLAATPRGRHLTVMATYRSDDIDRFHPLRPVLAELDRTRAIVRVEIEPLSSDEVAEQVLLLAASAVADDEVLSLAQRSGGIPFLVEELVDLGDAQLPSTLRDLVLARYARLSDSTQEVMRAMAAGGIHVSHDALQSVAVLDESDLDFALREAIEARVIVADGIGYSFRHALTQEAVHGELLPSERVRVHRRYATYLTEQPAATPDDVSAAAEHWLAARELTPAFDATVAALRHSLTTFAPATSAKLAERLAELWSQVPDAAARSGTTLPELHVRAAQSWHALGDPERALRSAREGLTVVVDDPVTKAALLRWREVEEFNINHTADRSSLREAVRLLEPLDDVAARTLLSRVLTNLAIDDHSPDARSNLRRAIAIAEDVGDDVALAVALTQLCWYISDEEGDEIGALAPLERALALQLDPSTHAHVGAAYTELLSRLGRFEAAAAFGRRLHADAVRSGIERGMGAPMAVSVAHSLFAAGDPTAGLAYALRARRLLDRAARREVSRVLSTHYAWNDQPDARAALLAEDYAHMDANEREGAERRAWWTTASVDAVLASAAGLSPEGDSIRWEQPIGSVIRSLRLGSPPGQRYAAVAGAVLVRSIAAASSADDLERSIELRESVRETVATWPHIGAAPAIATFIAATLADAGGAPVDQRMAGWRKVSDTISDGVMPVRYRHIARLSLSAALVEHGERDEASELLERIVAEAPGHGVASVGRWAAQLATRAGLTSDPKGKASPAIASLTPRERQVLALVAEGLTNSQIGHRLFISPKTASVHVSAILAKVGAANRAEAAAVFAASAADVD